MPKRGFGGFYFSGGCQSDYRRLACGKPIRGHVAFLGGPLHFLSELRLRFIETLKLTDETTIIPENSHLFAAYGTAVSNKGEAELDFDTLLHKLDNGVELTAEVSRMEPLFKDEADYAAFKERHDRDKVRRVPLSNYHGGCLPWCGCRLYYNKGGSGFQGW